MSPRGVGPHDVAIALCGAVYKNGFVKNKVLEFAGPAVSRLPMDYRIGIDVMTTETACLSSIWETDSAVADYLALHGCPETFTALHPQDGAYYDGMITIDLDRMEPMAALPLFFTKPFLRSASCSTIPATTCGRWRSAPPPSSAVRRACI